MTEDPLKTPALDRVAVALDTSDRQTFSSWCELFGPRVGVLKVGLEAFARWGREAVVEARRSARRLFLDVKLHDIPNTVRGAARATADLGVDLLTVHAGGGMAMLEAAKEGGGDQVGILAVTLLTHLDEADLVALDLPGEARERVRRWAGLAKAAGCRGVVCSPREVGQLRRDYPSDLLLVTPGIRFADSADGQDDQRRIATPASALADGSDLLVVGRPLTRATDPEAALERLADALEDA